MARYFFHLCDGDDVLLDGEGRELEPAEVRTAAMAEARAMIAADALCGQVFLDQMIEVRDDGGGVVYRLAFEDAVRITHAAVRRF